MRGEEWDRTRAEGREEEEEVIQQSHASNDVTWECLGRLVNRSQKGFTPLHLHFCTPATSPRVLTVHIDSHACSCGAISLKHQRASVSVTDIC